MDGERIIKFYERNKFYKWLLILLVVVVGYKWIVDEHEIEREDRRVEKEERRIIQRGIGWKVNRVCELMK